MKRFFCIWAAAVFAVACGGDNPLKSQEKALVGTWRHVRSDISGFQRAFIEYLIRQGMDADEAQRQGADLLSESGIDPSFPNLLRAKGDGTWTDNEGFAGSWAVKGTEGAYVLAVETADRTLGYEVGFFVEGDNLTLIWNGAQFLALALSDPFMADIPEFVKLFRDVLAPVSNRTVIRLHYTRVN